MLKNLNDWEISEYENLVGTLSIILLDGINDQPRRSLTNTGSFSVKSFYKHLTKQEDDGTKFPFRQTWKVKVPPVMSSVRGRL